MKTVKPSKSRNGHAPSIEAAAKQTLAEQVKADSDRREAECQTELAETLKRHNCSLHVAPHVVINGQPAGILVKANAPA